MPLKKDLNHNPPQINNNIRFLKIRVIDLEGTQQDVIQRKLEALAEVQQVPKKRTPR